MQGLIQEGNGEEFVRFSNDIEHAADLTPRQVRVRIMAAGVCGSDLSCVHGKYYMPTPLVPGHEAEQIALLREEDVVTRNGRVVSAPHGRFGA